MLKFVFYCFWLALVSLGQTNTESESYTRLFNATEEPYEDINTLSDDFLTFLMNPKDEMVSH